jgi:hypothetical protein
MATDRVHTRSASSASTAYECHQPLAYHAYAQPPFRTRVHASPYWITLPPLRHWGATKNWNRFRIRCEDPFGLGTRNALWSAKQVTHSRRRAADATRLLENVCGFVYPKPDGAARASQRFTLATRSVRSILGAKGSGAVEGAFETKAAS